MAEFSLNRYALARQLSGQILDMLRDYRLINNENGVNVRFEFEKHLPDRLIDHEFPKDEFDRILHGMMKRVGEMIYLVEADCANRINVYGDDDWMVGVTGKRTQNGNYIFKIRTAYKERNSKHRQRTIAAEKIYI